MSREDEALALRRDAHSVARSQDAARDAVRCLSQLARLRSALEASPAEIVSRLGTRLAFVEQIDGEMRRLVPPVLRAGLSPAAAARASGVFRDAFGALLDAYQVCTASFRAGEGGSSATEMGACGVGLARAAADRIKWERRAGGPAHPHLWPWIAAEFRKAATDSRPPAHPAGSVAGEYLRAVALSTMPLERLPIEVVDAVDVLVAFSLPMIQFQSGSVAGAIYWSPPDFAAAPRRIVRAADVAPAAWLFSPRMATKALEELAARSNEDAVLQQFAVRVGGRDVLRFALRVLQQHWGETAPTRRFRRHLLDGPLRAVRGIDELLRTFAGDEKPRWSEWTFRDASRGGLGVYAPLRTDGPVRVGELVGLRSPEGRGVQLAVVRRAWVENDVRAIVGLETLSQQPVLVSADDGSKRIRILLCDPMQRGETIRIVTPARALRADVPLFVTMGGSVQKLKSLDIGLSGEGFELRVCQVL